MSNHHLPTTTASLKAEIRIANGMIETIESQGGNADWVRANIAEFEAEIARLDAEAAAMRSGLPKVIEWTKAD